MLLPAVGGATQTCEKGNIPVATTPTSQFTDNNDGTVTDTKTGLMWKKCSEGRGGVDCSIGSAVMYTWKAALEQAQTVNTTGGFAGQVDWRVPNIKELRSIIEGQCYEPTINSAVFPNTEPAYFWSSSPLASAAGYAWYFNFWDSEGNWNYKAYGAEVRLVRDGVPMPP